VTHDRDDDGTPSQPVREDRDETVVGASDIPRVGNDARIEHLHKLLILHTVQTTVRGDQMMTSSLACMQTYPRYKEYARLHPCKAAMSGYL
jgi:hypothetical protein